MLFTHSCPTFLQSFVANVLKTGPVPRHIGFIMDGNRRYADKHKLVKSTGHLHGFNKLTETLEWCKLFGVSEVTVYAFSIENFKRSEEEVDALMSLARDKFNNLLREKDELKKNGVCIRFFGSIQLLPIDIQQLIAKITLETKNNKQSLLNVCFPYTSRHEISEALTRISDGVRNGFLTISDINERLIEKCLYTRQSSYPELIIRTSGEIRLSDFLLWQSSFSVLAFVNALWPNFSFWDFCYAIFYYQRHHKVVTTAKEEYLQCRNESETCAIENDYYLSEDLSLDEFKARRAQRINKFIVEWEKNELSKMSSLLNP